MTFIVRVTVDPSGRLQGILERVKTGTKVSFDDLSEIPSLIAGMAKEELAGGKDA